MNIFCQHELTTQNLNEYFLPTCTYPCWTMQDHAGPCQLLPTLVKTFLPLPSLTGPGQHLFDLVSPCHTPTIIIIEIILVKLDLYVTHCLLDLYIVTHIYK